MISKEDVQQFKVQSLLPEDTITKDLGRTFKRENSKQHENWLLERNRLQQGFTSSFVLPLSSLSHQRLRETKWKWKCERKSFPLLFEQRRESETICTTLFIVVSVFFSFPVNFPDLTTLKFQLLIFKKKLFCIKTSFFTLSNISIYLWITQMTQCPALPLVNFPPLSFHFLLLLSTFTFTFHFQDDTDDSVPSSPPSRSSTSPSPSLPSHSPTQAAQPSPLPQVGTVSNVNCNCPHTYTLWFSTFQQHSQTSSRRSSHQRQTRWNLWKMFFMRDKKIQVLLQGSVPAASFSWQVSVIFILLCKPNNQ